MKQVVNVVLLNKEKRIFVVKRNFEIHSFVEVRQLFREHFPEREPPEKKAIWDNVRKYE